MSDYKRTQKSKHWISTILELIPFIVIEAVIIGTLFITMN